MRPKTFRAIERKAGRGGYDVPLAVGGKAYWITVLNKYLDSHPGDTSAMRALRRLLETRRKRIGKNPKRLTTVKDWGSLPKAKAMTSQEKKFWDRYHKGFALPLKKAVKKNPKREWYVGFRRQGRPKVFPSRTKPTLKTYGYLFDFVTGPFGSRKEASRFKVHSVV